MSEKFLSPGEVLLEPLTLEEKEFVDAVAKRAGVSIEELIERAKLASLADLAQRYGLSLDGPRHN